MASDLDSHVACFKDDLVEKCQTYMWELFIVLLDSHSIKANSASFMDKIKGSDGFTFRCICSPKIL